MHRSYYNTADFMILTIGLLDYGQKKKKHNPDCTDLYRFVKRFFIYFRIYFELVSILYFQHKV